MTEYLTYSNIVNKLSTIIPEFNSILEEHLKDYEEILPHVLFGDLTRFIQDKFEHYANYADSQSLSILKKVFNLLEQSLESKDPQLHELIFISFLENLELNPQKLKEFKKLLGPHLTAGLNQIIPPH